MTKTSVRLPLLMVLDLVCHFKCGANRPHNIQYGPWISVAYMQKSPTIIKEIGHVYTQSRISADHNSDKKIYIKG